MRRGIDRVVAVGHARLPDSREADLPDSQRRRFDPAFAYVTTLFFVWGFVTSSIDPLVPSVKSVFHLDYAESLLTQFAWVLAYAVMSLPAAAVLSRLGYSRSIVAGLATMILGCLVVPLAQVLDSYWVVLTALFIIAAGVTLLQVAANPLAAALGRPQGAHFRLNLSQAFNSLGTVLGPIVASFLMLKGGVFTGEVTEAARRATLGNVGHQFLLVAVVIALLAVFLWLVRGRLTVTGAAAEAGAPLAAFRSGWALFGAVAIFLYVGAEVSIGSILINFLQQPQVLAVPADQAGRMVSLYWGGAMVGRLVGSFVLLRVPAGRVLGLAAGIAALLCGIVTQTSGHLEAWAALSIGLFNSIMFPTIFTLTLERSSAPVPATSGLLCMAIVGGAVLPQIFGRVADANSLAAAFIVPLLAYVCIVAFALIGRRAPVRAPVPAPVDPG
jgi:FHS family L-fucose permease-like MFS transporter